MSDTERTDMPRFGTNGNDYLEAKTGWWFFGSYEEVLYGYGGDDTLDGGNRDDTLFGGDGYDNLYGDDGDDYLLGEWGNDFLSGDNGNDDLNGGDGYDILTGGEGADYFIFNSPWQGVDTITDFNYAEGDKVQIDAIGFGIGVNETNRFSYDYYSGALFFDNIQLAWLNPYTDFVVNQDISIFV